MKKGINILLMGLLLNACVTEYATSQYVAPVRNPMDEQITNMGNRIEKLLISLSGDDKNCSPKSEHKLAEKHPLMQVMDFKYQGDGLKAIELLASKAGLRSEFIGKHLVPLPNIYIDVTNYKVLNILELIASKMGSNLVEVIYVEDERLIEVRSLGQAERPMTNKRTNIKDMKKNISKNKTTKLNKK